MTMTRRPRSTLTIDRKESFQVDSQDKQFSKQYANLYWLRLVVQRNIVLQRAQSRWKHVTAGPKHEAPTFVKRMLDVQQGQLCFIIGTLYMDMPLKPNVLEDLARDHYIAAPPPRRKFNSQNDEVMLEDESGRIRLIGQVIQDQLGTFVTGTIVAALGAETPSGDFKVVELIYPGLAPQSDTLSNLVTDDDVKMDSKDASVDHQDDNDDDDDDDNEWIALASGLNIGSTHEPTDVRLSLLCEWLKGELNDDDDDSKDLKQIGKITRLILCGNCLTSPDINIDESKPKRYGYDSSTFSASPTLLLDSLLSDVLTSLPISLMPGDQDPTAPTLPQQPLHKALLPKSESFEYFETVTNPCWFKDEINKLTMLVTSGQNLDDVFKYLKSEDRLLMSQQMLEWSHIAPTCPDTLWCYPFVDRDPFILKQLPNVYIIGNQPKFESTLVTQQDHHDDDKQTKQTRIILLPKFNETGQIVLISLKTLKVKLVEFGS
ncbi:DNA polymerase delta small subunit Cdc1 [Microbotryomycetes sp. JL221]|nr:DNA polymerase delta small subunit Cdc1 [Microbotryomycetes sp. JL221]